MKQEIIADIFIITGIATIGLGLWQLAPWISLTVTGAMIFGLGLASYFIRK
jgi:hypothetical protein